MDDRPDPGAMSPSSAPSRLERAIAFAFGDDPHVENARDRETFLNYFVDVTLAEIARQRPAFLLIRATVSNEVKAFWRGPAT
jgi:hypothetical protein